MFFNVDILYRNGPLALVWMAGNGDSLMKSGPSRAKYKKEIMAADLHRLIAMMFEQLPSMGSNNGLSLKKIACLFHGIVVIHHMQLDSTLKRLNQLYTEACKMRDLIDEDNIDTVTVRVDACTHLIKPAKGRKLLGISCSPDFQLQDIPMSPRALPQPMESDNLGFGEVSGFEAMIADETWFQESRRAKRKEDNADLSDEVPTKLSKPLESIREPIDIHQLDNGIQSQPFQDWDINPEEMTSFFAPAEESPPVDNVPVLEDNHLDNPIVPKNLEFDIERGDLTPTNRHTRSTLSFPPLRPIEEKDIPKKKKQPKPKAIKFNEDTELSDQAISRQAKAALGIDGFGPKFFELQKKASSLHAELKPAHRGLQFIEITGRRPKGASLLVFYNDIFSKRKNYCHEVVHTSFEEMRAAADENISKDSRGIVTASLISADITNDVDAENFPPFKAPQVLEEEMMETVADQDILPEMPDENPQECDDFNELHQDMQLFTAKLPTYSPKKSSDAIDENFLLTALSSDKAKFSEILPPTKYNRLQAAQGLMLLLRMQGEKKISMKQTPSKNGSDYGPISVCLLNAKQKNL